MAEVDREKSSIRSWATQRTVGWIPGLDRDSQLRLQHPDWPVRPGFGPAPPDEPDEPEGE